MDIFCYLQPDELSDDNQRRMGVEEEGNPIMVMLYWYLFRRLPLASKYPLLNISTNRKNGDKEQWPKMATP